MPNSKKLLDVEQAFVSSSFFHPPSTNHHSPPSPRLSCCVSKTLANSNRFAPTPPFTLSFVFVLRKISIKRKEDQLSLRQYHGTSHWSHCVTRTATSTVSLNSPASRRSIASKHLIPFFNIENKQIETTEPPKRLSCQPQKHQNK